MLLKAPKTLLVLLIVLILILCGYCYLIYCGVCPSSGKQWWYDKALYTYILNNMCSSDVSLDKGRNKWVALADRTS